MPCVVGGGNARMIWSVVGKVCLCIVCLATTDFVYLSVSLSLFKEERMVYGEERNALRLCCNAV